MKIEALACSYNCTSAISEANTDTHMSKHTQNYHKLQQSDDVINNAILKLKKGNCCRRLNISPKCDYEEVGP